MKTYKRFGRYLILDHLVDGGMAKLCRARFLGEQANKIVAIKMVHPQYSKDPSYRKMFEDELKLAFSLSHQNIAQTYDYGMVGGQLFTAMEYVDGANLKQYLDRLKKRNFVFPVEISTYIISQACQGLHYAHTFTDKLTGKPLNIVHRDISPHNLMMTFDGAVKVIDFGIAKAETNSEATQVGTIKGKLSYLAPEYLDGQILDCRYDLFAIGITFWELLCNRKLFTANNDLAVLKKIQACQIPAPSTINPHVPKELDGIILKALAKNRDDRYKNLDQFNRALVRFLYSRYPDFNPSDLGQFASQLFKEEIEKDRQKLLEFGKIDLSPYLEEMRHNPKGGAIGIGTEEDFLKTKGFTPTRSRVLEMNTEEVDTSNISIENKTGTKQRSRSRYISTVEDPKTQMIKRSGGTSTGSVPSVKKRSFPLVPSLIAASVAALFVFKFVLNSTPVDVPKKISKKSEVVEDHSSKQQKQKSKLYFGGHDPFMDVYVNNQKINYTGKGIIFDRNQKLDIRIEKSGYAPFYTSLNLSKDSEIIEIPSLKRAQTGLLTVSKNYSRDAKIIFEVMGKRIERNLPIKNYRLPAGRYEGTIIDPILGIERQVDFTIKENKRSFID